MSPSVLLPEYTSQLVEDGITHTITKTAHSLRPTSVRTQSCLAELDASRLIYTRNTNPKAVPEPNSAEVWAQDTCTDHMITCNWTSTAGWSAPHLEPYGPFAIMPTASVLHYATECFEGMKAYRGHDGRLRIFRPDRNTRRMLRSATRISLPAFNPDELQKLIIALLSVDGEKWLPKSRPGTFIYLRPTMIANAPGLGVQKPKGALLYIIACCFPSFDEPTGTVMADPTHSNGIPMTNGHAPTPRKPGLRLLASKDDMVRAWPGGFGFAKVGANYGPSLIAQAGARDRGYDQILWLFGKECQVTEAGASNFFVVWKTREGRTQVVTAPLDDMIILDGVTRRSVIELCRERLADECEVVERKYEMEEVVEALDEGRLVEAFAAGTAFFISPVSEIHFRGEDLDIALSEGVSGKYAAMLKMWLKNIMYGKEQHPWGVVIDEVGLEAF